MEITDSKRGSSKKHEETLEGDSTKLEEDSTRLKKTRGRLRRRLGEEGRRTRN